MISALSSEQQFIPYRNNKLTMLMQDSLGKRPSKIDLKWLVFMDEEVVSPSLDLNQMNVIISTTSVDARS